MSEETQQPESNKPEMPRRPSGRRRGRRGGRGRRRPSPNPNPSATDAPVEHAETAESFETAESTTAAETEFHETEAPPAKRSVEPPSQRRRGSPLMQAADDAADIIESLKQTLAQMEEVLELIELAERQKLIDEREIEALRRQLRQIQSSRRE